MQFGLNAALTAYQATTLHKFFQPENLVLSAGNKLNKLKVFFPLVCNNSCIEGVRKVEINSSS